MIWLQCIAIAGDVVDSRQQYADQTVARHVWYVRYVGRASEMLRTERGGKDKSRSVAVA